jgi:hypothetical protein
LNSKAAPWIGAGAAAAIAAVVGTFVAMPTTVFAGAGLSVLNDWHTDPHLLSSVFWHPIAASCSLSAHCIGALNVTAFAALCALVAYLTGRAKTEAVLTAGICGAIVATSPVAAALVIHPLGTEIFITIALFSGIAAICARLWNPPAWVRLLLPVALVLQDPLFLPAALLYAAMDRRRIALQAWSAAIILLSFGLRLAAGSPPALSLSHPALDAWAAPLTIVLLGIAIFILLPFVLWLMVRNFDRAAGFERRDFLAPAVLGFTAAAASIISWNGGDPSPYWLAAEISVILGFAAAVRDAGLFARRVGAVLGALAILVQLYEYPRAAAAFPNAAISAESTELWSSLRSAQVSRTAVCVTGEDRARAAVLGDGLFVRFYKLQVSRLLLTSVTGCLKRAPAASHIVALGYPRPPELSFALAQAADTVSHSKYVLAARNGTVYPATRASMPGGHGAFRSIAQSPLGPVPSFTVAAPFSYTFHCVRIAKSEVLSFAAANPLAGIPGAALTRFSIESAENGRKKLVLSRDLPPTPRIQTTDWRFYSVPVGPARCESLTFTVTSLSSVGIGAWTSFAGVTIDRRNTRPETAIRSAHHSS